MRGIGRILFALSVAGLGVISIAFHEFAVVWQLVPKTIAGHDGLAIASGAILIAGGVGLLAPRAARPAALVLAGVALVFVLLLRVPPLVTQPRLEANWYGLSETLTFVAGGWTIFSMLPARDGAGLGRVRLGQILFALTLPALGLAHFFYVDQTAPIIPAWLPFHVPLAYLTGAAHIAAGAGILFGVLPRLAATLEAAMVSLFTLLVWVPMVVAAPVSGFNLSELFLSAAISGTAWAVAESFATGTRKTARV
jgi:uncharacterized membrane protein